MKPGVSFKGVLLGVSPPIEEESFSCMFLTYRKEPVTKKESYIKVNLIIDVKYLESFLQIARDPEVLSCSLEVSISLEEKIVIKKMPLEKDMVEWASVPSVQGMLVNEWDGGTPYITISDVVDSKKPVVTVSFSPSYYILWED